MNALVNHQYLAPAYPTRQLAFEFASPKPSSYLDLYEQTLNLYRILQESRLSRTWKMGALGVLRNVRNRVWAVVGRFFEKPFAKKLDAQCESILNRISAIKANTTTAAMGFLWGVLIGWSALVSANSPEQNDAMAHNLKEKTGAAMMMANAVANDVRKFVFSEPRPGKNLNTKIVDSSPKDQSPQPSKKVTKNFISGSASSAVAVSSEVAKSAPTKTSAQGKPNYDSLKKLVTETEVSGGKLVLQELRKGEHRISYVTENGRTFYFKAELKKNEKLLTQEWIQAWTERKLKIANS